MKKACYAAVLQDCAGSAMSREHYISNALLKRFGSRFKAQGLSWTGDGTVLSPSALQSKILCERHNNMLSDLDSTAVRFFDVLADLRNGKDIGNHSFQGADLERWAIKVLLGLTASGSLRGATGEHVKPAAFPLIYLRILFAHECMPEDCGLYYHKRQIEPVAGELLTINVNHYPSYHEYSNEVFGLTIRLIGLEFLVSVTARLTDARDYTYRPGELRFQGRARGNIFLRWNPPPTIGLLLKV